MKDYLRGECGSLSTSCVRRCHQPVFTFGVLGEFVSTECAWRQSRLAVLLLLAKNTSLQVATRVLFEVLYISLFPN